MWLSGTPIPFLIPFLAGLFLIVLPISAQLSQPESDRGTWRTAAPMPMKRTEIAAAALEGKIYVVGGFEKPSLGNLMSPAITPALDVYDPATDRWTSKAPLPIGLHHAGIGVAGGRLYVIGGYSRSMFSVRNPVATVYAYDPVTDTWTERAPLPTARGALSVTELDGKLYAVGGYDGKGNNAQVEVYDPIFNAWTARAPLPTPRDHLAVATVAGKIYAIGGRVNGDYHRNLAITERYDPAADRWLRVSDLPTARSGIAAAVAGGKIYVFGGEGAAGTFSENETYDPVSDLWRALASMPTARHGLGAAAVRGQIHVLSGGTTPGGSFSDLNEVFTPPLEANRRLTE
jgi:N-acetylneuraminic acid mutarotase